ncbi:glycoprotein [Killamcar virus 1]|nr:glycoprotein [Killamcar virus 1]
MKKRKILTDIIMSIKFLLLLVCYVASKEVMYLPRVDVQNWKPTVPNNLECPRDLAHTPSKNSVDIYAMRIFKDMSKKVHGYLCHATIWYSKCYENFLLIKTESRYIQNTRAMLENCKDAIRQLKEGTKTAEFFPAFDCAWMSTNTKSAAYHTITEHDVIYDPYTSKLVDSEFLNGHCEEAMCKTSSDSIIWLAEDKIDQSCSLVKEKAKLDPVEHLEGIVWDEGATISTVSLPKTSFRNACWLHFCGAWGVRFITGEWVHFPDYPSISTENKHFPGLPACKPDTKIAPHSVTTELEMPWMGKADYVAMLECIDALDLAKTTNKISQLTLNHVIPNHPGVGYAYRINQGTLERVYTEYIPVVVNPMIRSEEVGFYDDNNSSKPYIWPNWVESGIEGVLSGPNGMTKINGSVRIPLFGLKYQMPLEKFDEYISLNGIDHPVLKIVKTTMNISDSEFNSDAKGGSLVDLISFKFGSEIMHWIVIVIIIIVVIVALVITIKCCFICCKSNRNNY